MAYFENDGRRNYFVEFGSGRPVVLLHGVSNSGRAWAPQIPALVRAGFRVIVPDHAGHGASRPINRPIAVSDLANDVLALLDHLGLECVDLIGLSLGGMAALHLALDRPARIGKLVVANSFPSWTGDAFRTLGESWAAIFRGEDGPTKRLERTWPMLVNEAFRASDAGLQTYQTWHGVAATADGASLAYVAEGIHGFDLSEKLSTLSPPTLFIAGELDRLSLPAVSRWMAAAAPRGLYAELPGASHLSNVDSPDAFNAELLPFLLTEETCRPVGRSVAV